ncbi:MAG: zinc-binding dehydrogenase [Arthrobacter sp.]|jgi:NADPH:quinone reductase-like Zn-dependent oxidoreductase|nr:zinc-binding dehydrogenase [Arthrobacter sp.]
MRILSHASFGDPADVLHPAEAEAPAPAAGEALVRLVLSPIHNHDVLTVKGVYGFKPELPAGAGTEALGVVEALGEGVTGLSVGQRVVIGGRFGAWAELFTAPAAGLLPVPDAITDEAAAQLVSMPFSALSLLDSLGLEAGDWLVIDGANGAVGRLVAQFARARGIHALGVVRREAGVAELAAQGIETVVSTETEGWRERALEITGGAPIKAAVDQIGGDIAGELVTLLAQGGTLVVFGAMAGRTMPIPSSDVIFKELTVRGFWGSKVSTAMDPAHKRELMGEIFARVAAGEVTLPTAGVFSFDELPAALSLQETPGRTGKVLLRP